MAALHHQAVVAAVHRLLLEVEEGADQQLLLEVEGEEAGHQLLLGAAEAVVQRKVQLAVVVVDLEDRRLTVRAAAAVDYQLQMEVEQVARHQAAAVVEMRRGSWQVAGVEEQPMHLQHWELWEEAVGEMQDSSHAEEVAVVLQAQGFDWEVLEGQTFCVLLGMAEEQCDAMCFLPPGFSGVGAGAEVQDLLLRLLVAD